MKNAKFPSWMRRNLTALSRRTAAVSIVQLKFAARTVFVVALAAVCLAAVVHHRPAFWILANGHQAPRDLLAATPKPMATTGIAGTFTTFEAPDAGATALEGTGGLAINASGEIAGVYSNQVGVYRGFVRATNGTVTEFDAVPYTTLKAGQGTIPISINSAGDIAGTYIDTNNVNHGFVRTADGTITVFLAGPLATSRSQGTVAMSINDAGQVAGFYLAQTSKGFAGPFDGFVRAADGTITTFSAPGSSTSYAAGTQVYSINASGDIAGSYVDTSNDRHGFVLTPGGAFTPFDPQAVTTAARSRDRFHNALAAHFRSPSTRPATLLGLSPTTPPFATASSDPSTAQSRPSTLPALVRAQA